MQPDERTFAMAYETQIDALIAQMTLAEKIGQMTQVEKNSLSPQDVTTYALGSVLSGGGGNPTPNTPQTWAQMVREFQQAALATRLQIPLLYGSDCIHGHNNMVGAVLFPHNIGLGASRDEALAYEIGRITAREMLASNVHWNFGPAVSIPQDVRWGRSYEGYSEQSSVVIAMSRAYARGLMAEGVLPSIKHFVADGATLWGTTPKQNDFASAANWQAATDSYTIDQGDARIDEATLRQVHIAPYIEAIAAGALNIMVSFS
ncbi:MAG: glycoside hydrolase family 3 protein, partial [Phototrophicaceae bacterium]